MRTIVSLLLLLTIASCASDTGHQKTTDQQSVLSETDMQAYESKAKEVITSSFSALSHQLMAAIAQGGTSYAVSFCNMEALEITDSLSATYGVEIKRLALMNRNPFNAPNESETIIMQLFDDRIKNGNNPGDTLVLSEKSLTYYAPILTATACLQCHGTPEKDIHPETLKVINDRYPNDKAVNFSLAALRGMWSIRLIPAKNE